MGVSAFGATGSALSVASGRLSFTYGAQGPCMSIDTACSAALVAAHLAVKAISAQECGGAAACGTNLTQDVTTSGMFAKAGMLSPEGRCKTLAQDADGYVRGEACVSALLGGPSSSSEPAVLVKGSTVNQDGRSSSLTAPNGPSQQAAIFSALRAAGVGSNQIGALQMHGTGTPLGDPIEVGAAQAVLLLNAHPYPLALSALKSSIGHSEAPSGLVGLLQIAMALQSAQLSPILHLRSMNPYVSPSLVGSNQRSAAVPRQPAPIAGGIQLAGASSFAFQGTNAHAIVEAGRRAVISGILRVGRLWHKRRVHVMVSPHSLVWRSLGRPSFGGLAVMEVCLGADSLGLHAYFWDHAVSGRALFPAAGFFELACGAARSLAADSTPAGLAASCLAGVSIPSPCLLSAPGAHVSVLRAEFSVEPQGSGRFHISGGRAVHVSGSVAALAADAFRLDDGAASSRTRGAHTQCCTGTVELISPLWLESGCWSPPAALDGVMQLAASAAQVLTTRVPAAAGAFASFSPLKGAVAHAMACAGLSAGGVSTASSLSSHRLTVSDFKSPGELSDLETKALRRPTAASAHAPSSESESCLFDLEWQALGQSHAAGSEPVTELILSSGGGLKLPGATGIALDPSAPVSPALSRAMDVFQGMGAVSGPPSLMLATRHGHPSCSEASRIPSSLEPGLLHGLMRTASQELVGVEASGSDVDARSLGCRAPPASCDSGSLSRWSERGAAAHVARLLPSAVPATAGAVSLFPSPRGSFAALLPRTLPASHASVAGAVELSVRSVGLNFRDVLNVLGMYPGDPGAPGADCAGVVVSGAAHEAGLAVFGLAPGALGTHVSALAAALPAKPPALAFEAAASLPTVCVTVDLALRQAAGWLTGSYAPVLVHAAAGGVGLAAVGALSTCGSAQASVSTAGSARKRALLRGLGESRVAGSRDTAFADVAAMGTFGSGAAAVLNSLTSAGMVGASLACLSERGCLSEIGKRDIWSPARVASERADAAYCLVALDFLPTLLVSVSLRCLSEAAAGGWLAPSPSVSYELGATHAALRALSQARNVGKVVVCARAPASQGLRSGSADVCLVSGGLGSLGGLVGLWLAQRGSEGPGSTARLILVGRSGRHEGRSPLMSLLARSGASSALVTFGRCDAASASEAAAALVPPEASGGRSGRLASLMHAGGVLQDATLANQTASGARAVVAPKVDALSRLSGALGAHPLASAALFSSVSSLTGSPGQSNYSAANAAMDAWSHARQAGGFPSLSVQWGAWASGGMAARDKSVSQRMERTGMGLLSADQGFSALQSVVHALHSLPGSRISVRSELGASPFSWPRLLSRMQPVPAVYTEFIPTVAPSAEGRADAPFGSVAGPGAGAASRRREDVAAELLAVVKGVLGSEVRFG